MNVYVILVTEHDENGNKSTWVDAVRSTKKLANAHVEEMEKEYPMYEYSISDEVVDGGIDS